MGHSSSPHRRRTTTRSTWTARLRRAWRRCARSARSRSSRRAMPNGDTGGAGFDFGGIFDSLLGVLAGIIQAIINFLVSLVSALVQVLNFLYAGELGIFGFSFAGLDKIYRGLKNIQEAVFTISVTAALNHVLSLYQRLT